MSSDRVRTVGSVSRLLSALPEHDPDPGLWLRIQSARARRQRLRRRSWLGAGLAAAAVLVVAVLARAPSTPPSASDVASWRERSHVLEQEWLASSRTAMDPRLRAELRLIDGQLQAAYDRGATDGELVPLWKLRSEALQDLIRSDDASMRAVTRI